MARPPLWLLLAPGVVLVLVAALTPTSVLLPHQGDLNLYLEKAAAFASGRVPYRDIPLEYPPLALVPMVVPYLLWPFGPVDLDAYKWLFAGFEAVLVVVLGLVLARVVSLGGDVAAGSPTARRVRAAAERLLVLTVGAALVFAWRYDLFPALLTLVALWAALRGRPAVAGVALGLGVLAKLYPVALLPALAVPWLVPLDLPRLARFGAATAATIVLGLLPFVALAGADAFGFLSYQTQRPLQIESIGGGVVLLLGVLSGTPAELSFSFSSVNVAGQLAGAIVGALPVVTAAAFLAVAYVGWRCATADVAVLGRVTPSTVSALALASVLALLVTSKVFSIQYVAWLVPFAALLAGRQFVLAAAAVALTFPIHPLLYGPLVEQETLPILLLNVRNALLVGLFAWVLLDLRRRPAEAT